MIQIEITEHKSVGTLSPRGNTVRVFVNRDFGYGYFVDEQALFALLSVENQVEYLRGTSARLKVSKEIAQAIIDMGKTIFTKQKL